MKGVKLERTGVLVKQSRFCRWQLLGNQPWHPTWEFGNKWKNKEWECRQTPETQMKSMMFGKATLDPNMALGNENIENVGNLSIWVASQHGTMTAVKNSIQNFLGTGHDGWQLTTMGDNTNWGEDQSEHF